MFKRKATTRGAIAPRLPFWEFSTRICGLNQPDSKVQFTTAQRALWRSVDRRVGLTPEEAEAYRALTGKAPWTEGSKAPPFICQTLCRGGGKTLLLATIACYEAATNPYQGAPGETVAVVILCPRVKQARDLMRYAKAHFERDTLRPLLAGDPVKDEIRLRNGRIIRVQAVDKSGGAARGPTYICSLFDESAFLNHDGLVIDQSQWQAVLAGSRGVESFRGVLSSTPNGQSGFFYETFFEHFGATGTAWEVFKGPVDLIRPDMDQGLLQEYMRADEEAYKREFLCDFSAGTGSQRFFVAGQVESAIMQGVVKIEPEPLATYTCSVDPSGGAHDVFTVTIIQRLEDGTLKQVLCRGYDPKESPITVHDIAREIRDLIAPYGVRAIYGDIFGGNWVSEAFAAVGLEYQTRGFNAQQKVQRAAALRESFQTGRLKLLDIAEQTRELVEYEQKTLPSGQVSVNHPNVKGGSDDYLDALALAHWEALGSLAELHPPDGLYASWNTAETRKLYRGGKYPYCHEDRFLSAAEIAAKGEGPAWIIDNALKHVDFALYSLGELAAWAGVSASQLMAHWGRDAVLQHAWMRWTLAETGRNNPRALNELGVFPAIPVWPEIRRKVIEAERPEDVIKFSFISNPFGYKHNEDRPGEYSITAGNFFGRWPIDFFCPSLTRGQVPACPPWLPPFRRWNVFPENSEIFELPEQIHTKAINEIFDRAAARRKAEIRKYKKGQVALQAPNNEGEGGAIPFIGRSW